MQRDQFWDAITMLVAVLAIDKRITSDEAAVMYAEMGKRQSRDADLRALDDADHDWCMFARPPGHGVGCKVRGKLFTGETPDEARAKAAAWARGELDTENKRTQGAR